MAKWSGRTSSDFGVLRRALFGNAAPTVTSDSKFDMHPVAKELFGGLRWRPYGGLDTTPSHGGTRVVDIITQKRSQDQMLAGIAEEQAEHGPVIREFARAFYKSRQTWGMTFYEGIPVLKNPMDLWVLQEIIFDLKPTLIIETGTAFGGSALYYARQLDRVGEGKVISIDIEPTSHLPVHERVTYLKGYSSTDPNVGAACERIAAHHPRVMVVLDSDHSAAHVTEELESFAPMVTPGQFLVVEDTNINGRPIETDWKGGPGPGPAVDAWLPQHPEFEQSLMAERYMVTHNPGGWLRRKPQED